MEKLYQKGKNGKSERNHNPSKQNLGVHSVSLSGKGTRKWVGDRAVSNFKKKPAFEEKERRGKVCGGFLYLIVFLTSSSEEGGKVFGF